MESVFYEILNEILYLSKTMMSESMVSESEMISLCCISLGSRAIMNDMALYMCLSVFVCVQIWLS